MNGYFGKSKNMLFALPFCVFKQYFFFNIILINFLWKEFLKIVCNLFFTPFILLLLIFYNFSISFQTELIKFDLEIKMSQHKLEQQIEKVQYNQTAVMLLIDTCQLVRENTSRAVTSLDNMVLYFMKTKGSENDTSLMGLLYVSIEKSADNELRIELNSKNTTACKT